MKTRASCAAVDGAARRVRLRYAISVVRASLSCLAVLAFPSAVCYRAASVPPPDATLRAAVANGDVPAMERAVAAGARVDGRDAFGFSPLADAIGHGRPQAVAWLLRHGADVNGKVAGGATPLFLALGARDPGVLRALLDAGADPNTRSPGGRTALAAACGHGGEARVLEMVDALLAAGADPDAPDVVGIRPAAAATEAGHAAVARRLLAASRAKTDARARRQLD